MNKNNEYRDLLEDRSQCIFNLKDEVEILETENQDIRDEVEILRDMMKLEISEA